LQRKCFGEEDGQATIKSILSRSSEPKVRDTVGCEVTTSEAWLAQQNRAKESPNPSGGGQDAF
jgi:hypothetical protein